MSREVDAGEHVRARLATDFFGGAGVAGERGQYRGSPVPSQVHSSALASRALASRWCRRLALSGGHWTGGYQVSARLAARRCAPCIRAPPSGQFEPVV